MNQRPQQRETAFLIQLSKTFKILTAYDYISMGKDISQEQKRVFLNPRQVFRVVGSLNHHNGKVVSMVNSLCVRASFNHVSRNRAFELSEMKAVIEASPIGEKARRFGIVSGSSYCRKAQRADAPSSGARPQPSKSAGNDFRNPLIGGF